MPKLRSATTTQGRNVSLSLKNFALLATSADKGTVRDASKLEN